MENHPIPTVKPDGDCERWACSTLTLAGRSAGRAIAGLILAACVYAGIMMFR